MERKTKLILDELAALYPDAQPALKFRSPYELLVAVILSAQCTDERVNKVTEVLFERYNTPQKMLDICEKFGGEVPATLEELKTLAGVGQKTANVVYAVAFGGDAIAVDTHVFRVSNRLGIAEGKTPAKVEEGLCAALPKEEWSKAHHYLIYHGRRVCHSQRPDCANCTLKEHCAYFNNIK